jgi:hypothetical protein
VLRELMQEMFSQMVEAKDITQVEKYYEPDFLLYTNGQVQDYASFHAGHARVYPTEISYAVEYDNDAWVEAGDRLGGRMWITTKRPAEAAARIEVIFLAVYRQRRIRRLWELTWPDWSQLGAFETYG